jgi:hypothetical protein
MEVLTGGQWEPATPAVVLNTAGISGVVGQLQDPTLTNDQIVIGGESPTLDSGVSLWNGTATDGGLSTVSDAAAASPPDLQVACPSANTTVGGKLVIPITATSPAGIASVAVSVSPASGNSDTPLCQLTAPPYTCVWDTTSDTDGQYFLFVSVTDAKGFIAYEDVLVNVSQSASSPCLEATDGGSGGDGGSPAADAGEVDASGSGAGDGGTVTDGGTTPTTDGGGGGTTGGPNAAGGGNDPQTSSCGCRAVGSDSPGAGPVSALLLLGIAIRVRGPRRRRRLSP